MTEQVEWKNYRGTYLGLAEAEKTGKKKDGSVWKRNKLNFSHAEGKQVKFGTFQDITGLQMNQQYTVLFKEDEIMLPDGTTGKTKTAVKIEPHTDQSKPLGFEQPPVQQAVQQNTPIPTLQPRQLDPKQFAEAYKTTKDIPEDKKTVEDFAGRFMKNTNKEQFELLKQLFESVVNPAPAVTEEIVM